MIEFNYFKALTLHKKKNKLAQVIIYVADYILLDWIQGEF